MPSESDVENLTVEKFVAMALEDDDSEAARQALCETIKLQMREIGSWLAVDSWLGGCDISDTSTTSGPTPDSARSRSFVAVGIVGQIAAELIWGAQDLLSNENDYAASALVRQLIECEYLFRVFQLDFAEGSRWLGADDRERWGFRPQKLRKVGGFDDVEYKNHCDAGGHPHPNAQALLILPRTMNMLAARLARDESVGRDDLFASRVLRLDFTFHCERTWRALYAVLSAEHARFTRVRSDQIEVVTNAVQAWYADDPLARVASVILPALVENPTARVADLIGRPI